MPDTAQAPARTATAEEVEILHVLNRGYVRAAERSDVRWYDENLAAG